MKIRMLPRLVQLIFVGVSGAALAQPEDWVRAADQVRNPAESYRMVIQVDSDGGTPSVFEVHLEGQEKTLILTKEPARDKGRNMLMLDRDFHAYVPNLKRSMRLSLAQKLNGQVANGDISRTRWYGDYSVALEQTGPKENQLLLKAKKENLTYAWIRLWLDREKNRPLRAEYLGLNGKTVLKRAWFEDYRQLAGAERPGTIRIEDNSGARSFIRVETMEPRRFPSNHFTVRNMESLR